MPFELPAFAARASTMLDADDKLFKPRLQTICVTCSCWTCSSMTCICELACLSYWPLTDGRTGAGMERSQGTAWTSAASRWQGMMWCMAGWVPPLMVWCRAQVSLYPKDPPAPLWPPPSWTAFGYYTVHHLHIYPCVAMCVSRFARCHCGWISSFQGMLTTSLL